MSRRMSYICDICGREITGHSAEAIASVSARIQFWGPGDYRSGSGQRMDLCMDCYERFVSFLENGRDEE